MELDRINKPFRINKLGLKEIGVGIERNWNNRDNAMRFEVLDRNYYNYHN
jgi:hypothetical protein